MPPTAVPLRRFIVPALLVVALLGLGAEVLARVLPWPGWEVVLPFLSLSYEANLPTWIASSLLMACGLCLLVIARHTRLAGAPHVRAWTGLGMLFLLMSLDEAVQLHEHLVFFELSGPLYFSWVIPGAMLALAAGLSFLGLLRSLPADRRRQVLVCGGLYLGGALGMELPLGWWTDRHGPDGLGYAAIDHLEETLELMGAGLFLAWLIEELAARYAPRLP